MQKEYSQRKSTRDMFNQSDQRPCIWKFHHASTVPPFQQIIILVIVLHLPLLYPAWSKERLQMPEPGIAVRLYLEFLILMRNVVFPWVKVVKVWPSIGDMLSFHTSHA